MLLEESRAVRPYVIAYEPTGKTDITYIFSNSDSHDNIDQATIEWHGNTTTCAGTVIDIVSGFWASQAQLVIDAFYLTYDLLVSPQDVICILAEEIARLRVQSQG